MANNSSAIQEKVFVSDTIKELLDNKCVEPLNSVPEIVEPFSVSVQSSGKKRLILDLRSFHLVEIFPAHRNFCPLHGILGTVKFNISNFGFWVIVRPYLFTKLFKPLVRCNGIPIVVFLTMDWAEARITSRLKSTV